VDDVIYGQIYIGCSRSENLSAYRAASLFDFLKLRHGILTIHADFTSRDFEYFIWTVCEDWCR